MQAPSHAATWGGAANSNAVAAQLPFLSDQVYKLPFLSEARLVLKNCFEVEKHVCRCF